MTALNPRLNTPISTAELERRWKAVRAAMEAAGIDAPLMQNNNDHMGGAVKYFTDVPATNGYAATTFGVPNKNATSPPSGSHLFALWTYAPGSSGTTITGTGASYFDIREQVAAVATNGAA